FGEPDGSPAPSPQTSRQEFTVKTFRQEGSTGPDNGGRRGRRAGVGGVRALAVLGVPGCAVLFFKERILFLGFPGGEVRRPPLVGMQFLHERTVGASDFAVPRARLQAKDLIGLLRRHFATRRRAALPPCRITLRVLTPGGKPAVQIAFK